MIPTSKNPWNWNETSTRLCRRLGWLLGGFGLAGLALGLTGCHLLVPGSSPPKAALGSLQSATNRAVGSVPVIVLHAEAMRFADSYAVTVAQAADDLVARAATPEARLIGLRWKLGQATAAWIDASGGHPVLNALDLVVLATVSRMVVEDYGVVQAFGEAALPLLETHRKLETNAWALVNGVLKLEQRQELADMIQQWRQSYPHQRYVGGIRFRELAVAVGKSLHQANNKPTSVFSLLYLDPLAGMDPTAAALQEARYSAERAMYYGQRMPQLLTWQAELLAYQLAAQPESKQILSNAQRLVSSVESFAETSRQLPQQLTDAFVAEEKKARELLDETHRTLRAGNEMAGSVNAAIKSLDEFVRFVTPTNSTAAANDTNSRPFNVLDYGTAAAQVAVAAKELNALLTAVNDTTPQLAHLSEQASERADRVLNRAFGLGLRLVVVFLAGLVLVGLIYRALVKRLTSHRREP